MMKKLKFLGGLLLAAGLAACGGGGGSPGTNPNQPNPPSAVTSSVEIFTSSTELSTAANSSLSFTVVAKDANNQAVPNQTVTFAASSGNLVGALPAPTTGAAGEAITNVSLNPGSDRSNRNITVTVTAGGATRQITVPVTGTTLALSGNGSLLLGSTASFTVRAQDSAGQPISGATINLSSSLGNGINPATVTTSTQGAATFTYTGTNAGNDTLRATGLGAEAFTQVGVSADVFQFETPAAGTTIDVGASQTVTVRFLRNGTPVAGQNVTFSTTRGGVSPLSATTDAQGRASAVISSSNSGPATIVAQVPSAQVNLAVNYVATVPATIVLQANPGSVPPNTAGSTTNQITLLATVRDAAGNPVAGRAVNFTAVTDGSNGTINPGSATTDASGGAQVQFIPGGLSTANNGVVIQATVAGTGISSTASVTVNARALFISIGTGNVISNLDPQTYEKEFSVYVTDANGAPAAGQVVSLEVIPTSYGKGMLELDSDDNYVQPRDASGNPNNLFCPNEDTNRNGILNPGEDVNGNGRLEPGLPVIVAPGSVTTSSNGLATFKLQYGENYSLWVDTLITARTSVGGTESVKAMPYFLNAMLSDQARSASPSNVVSPFGIQQSCSDSN